MVNDSLVVLHPCLGSLLALMELGASRANERARHLREILVHLPVQLGLLGLLVGCLIVLLNLLLTEILSGVVVANQSIGVMRGRDK